MKTRLIAMVLVLLFLGSASAAAPYCSDIFGNTNHIVSPAIYNNTTFSSVLSISMLIVLAVLAVLALAYAIGYGFGINKLVTFVKTEYVESAFNILLIVAIAGGIGAFSGVSSFFTNAAILSQPSATTPFTDSLTLYTSICNNILSNQIVPAFGYFIQTTIESMSLNFISGTEIFLIPSGTFFVTTIPGLIIRPFSGLNFIINLIGSQSTVAVLIMAIDISTIFLLFAIYFIFPIFLYLGVLFRSFPWTRAAGGTLLSLFISFYIVFPAIIYPISAIPPALSAALATLSSTSLPSISQNTDLLAFVQSAVVGSYNSAASSRMFFTPEYNVNLYAMMIGFFAMLLVGLFIAFLIAYDLSQILARALGAPSFNASRIMTSVL